MNNFEYIQEMMENESETETIRDAIYKYLNVNCTQTNIHNAKAFLKNYIPEETLEHINFVPELTSQFKISKLSRSEFIIVFKCLFAILNSDELKSFVEDYEYLITNIDIGDDEDMYQLYCKILSCVEDKIGSNDVTNVKECFRCIVDSERTFSDIRTLSQLMGIIEDRDAVSENDLSTLECLLGKLNENEHVIMAKRLVSLYSKLSEMQYGCKICGCQTKFNLKLVSGMNIELNERNDKKLEEHPNDELKLVMIFLAKNLGPDWKNLARALDIRESKIKCLVDENPKDVEEQIMQMLLFWRNTEDDASIKKLLTALKGPICRKMLIAKEIEQGRHLTF